MRFFQRITRKTDRETQRRRVGEKTIPRFHFPSLYLSVTLSLIFVYAPSVATTAGSAGEKAGESKLPAPGTTSWASFRNGHLQQGVAGSSLPEKLDLLWKFPTQHGVVAASAIVGDHVYVPALEGMLFCLDRKTGKPIWKYRSIPSKDPDEFAPGFKATPTVTEDLLYLGDEDGLFHAVNRATGKNKWIFKAQAEIAGAAAVVGKQVIFGSRDGFLYCLNAADGSVVWKYQVDGPINCSPAIVEKYTFTAGCEGGNLIVVDIESGSRKSEIALDTPVLSSPAILDNMLYLGTHDGELLGIDWKEEKVVWRYRDPKLEHPIDASAAVTEKYVLAGGHDRQMHCIDRKTGKRVWVFPTRARIDSSPVVAGERVFFGSDDRNFYGLNLADGKPVWKFNAGSSVTAAPAVGEGVLVFGATGSGGAVFCFGSKQ